MNLPHILKVLGYALVRAATLLVFGTCLLQSGCAGRRAGIVIHDYATGKTAAEIPMGNFREIVRTEAHPVGAFFTMTEENNQLIIRKRDATGKELTKNSMPILNSVWHEPNWCALDDSGGWLAYFDDETKRLKLRNLKSDATTELPTPKIGSAVSIRLFAWTGPDSLLLLTTLPNDSSSMEISHINTRDRAMQTKPVGLDWFPYPILSSDRKWVAGVTGSGQLVVLDSSTSKRKFVIAAFDPQLKINCPKWSADSEWLFYVTRRAKDDKNELFRQSLATNSREELPLPTENNFYLQDSLGDTITASIVGTADTNWILDVKQRSWRTIGRSNCEIYGIRGTSSYAVSQ